MDGRDKPGHDDTGSIVPNALPGHNLPMIRIDKISKQNGHQIVFIEASAVILRGEKVGLVGPNGAGR